MPRATAEAAAETARRLLDSATALFAERGFAAVSVDDVARAAGVTRGAAYHHYGSKTDLFGAVATALSSSVADAVVAAAEAGGPDPAIQLRRGCHAFLDAITDGAASRVLLVDTPAVLGWEEWRRIDDTSSGVHLREALTAVGVADDLVAATAAQLSGAMNEAALWCARHDDRTIALRQSHLVLEQLLDAAPLRHA